MSTFNLARAAFLVSILLASTGFGRMTSMSLVADQTKLYRSPFRYIILSNDVSNLSGDKENSTRTVSVLLDEKAFSEDTLRSVFTLVSKRFSAPERLDVWLYTSLDQLDTPEERDNKILISESKPNRKPDTHHWAFFFRSPEGDEVFRYSPSPPSTVMKTVILKGKDRKRRSNRSRSQML